MIVDDQYPHEGRHFMRLVLYVFGWVALLMSVIYGIFSGEILQLLFSLFFGISGALILISLGKLLENQGHILNETKQQNYYIKKLLPSQTCSYCHTIFSGDRNDCPQCGEEKIRTV